MYLVYLAPFNRCFICKFHLLLYTCIACSYGSLLVLLDRAPFCAFTVTQWSFCGWAWPCSQLLAFVSLVAVDILAQHRPWLLSGWRVNSCACMLSQLCPTLCDPMGCSLPGSSIHGISHARIVEWVAISFSREFSWPRDRTHISCVSCTAGKFFTIWATRGSPWLQWQPWFWSIIFDFPQSFTSSLHL